MHRKLAPRAACLALLLGTSLVAPGEASAHAELVSSDPAPNAVHLAPPAALTLAFSQQVDPATAVVMVGEQHGALHGGVGAVEADGAQLRVALPELAAGVHTVEFRVTSALDGHVTTGSFAFLVDPAGTLPAPTITPTTETSGADVATVVARWIGMVALLALAGTALFWLWSVVAAGRPVDAPWLALAALAFLAFAGYAAYLSLAAAPLADAAGDHGGHGGLTGFPLDFAAPFGWTPFGAAMRVVLVSSAVTFVVAAARAVGLDEARRAGRSPDARRDRIPLLAYMSLVLVALGGASVASNAAALGGPLGAAMELLHLAAAASWLGALAGAALLARHGGAITGEALRRYVPVVVVAAPILALTGLANSPMLLGVPRGLVDNGYGNLLIAKAILFSIGLGLAIVGILVLRAAFGRRAAALLIGLGAVGAAAVLLAASLVSLQPAATRQPTTAPAGLGTTHLLGTAGELTVHVGVTRPSPGPQRYQVAVVDAHSNTPRSDVATITLAFTPPAGSDAPSQRVEAQVRPNEAVWGAAGDYMPLPGEWQLDAAVSLANGSQETVSFRLPVTEAEAPATLPRPDTGVGMPAPIAALYSLLPRGALVWLPAVVLFAGVAALTAYSRRDGGRAIAWTRTALVVLAVVAGTAAGARAAVDLANAPPAEASTATNPIAPSAESVERGRRLYVANCAACHGRDGSGGGPAASGMLPAPGDLPAAVREATDGALEHRIGTGKAGTRMPSFAATLSEDDRWDLVNYLRAESGRAD